VSVKKYDKDFNKLIFIRFVTHKKLLPNCFHFSQSDTNFSIRCLTNSDSALPHRTWAAALTCHADLSCWLIIHWRENEMAKCHQSIKSKRVIVTIAKLYDVVILCEKNRLFFTTILGFNLSSLFSVLSAHMNNNFTDLWPDILPGQEKMLLSPTHTFLLGYSSSDFWNVQ